MLRMCYVAGNKEALIITQKMEIQTFSWGTGIEPAMQPLCSLRPTPHVSTQPRQRLPHLLKAFCQSVFSFMLKPGTTAVHPHLTWTIPYFSPSQSIPQEKGRDFYSKASSGTHHHSADQYSNGEKAGWLTQDTS